MVTVTVTDDYVSKELTQLNQFYMTNGEIDEPFCGGAST